MRFRRHQESADTATRRMLAGFTLALAAIVAAVNLGLALLWKLVAPGAQGYPALFFETNTAVVLLLVLGGCWIETLRLREGGAHVARLLGARPLGEPSGAIERRLANVVQEVAIAARVAPPEVWVLPRDGSINAFAAGMTGDDTVLGVTQGALQRLTRAELQGLVAHEVGHIASGDTALMTRLVGLVWGLQLVHGLGLALAARDDRGRLHAGAIVGAVLIAAGWAGWLAGRLLQAAVARQREFRADASAVQYARTVDGIGGALRKIAGPAAQAPPPAPQSLAHLWLAEAEAPSWQRWLATHPPIAERLARLYGREVGALPAPVLPPPAEADEPVLAFAPGPIGPAAPQAPAARRAAAAQAPAAAAQEAERDEAFARSAYWSSPGESRAALLAWLVDEGDAASWAGWQRFAGDAPYVARLRADWLRLDATQRWQVSDRAIARLRAGSAADRATLVRAARQIAPRGAARLRRLLLLRCILAPEADAGRRSLEELAAAYTAACALLAGVLGAGGAAWAQRLRAGDASASPWRARHLRRLHPMQRPRVARAWSEAALVSGLLDTEPRAADRLAAACRLLATPVPPPLLARLADRPRTSWRVRAHAAMETFDEP